MTQLAHQVLDQGVSGPMSEQECDALLEGIPEWRIIDRDGIMKLERHFIFNDFADALAFTQQVGDIAERAGHHPRIVTEWGKTGVTWWSHDLGGLQRNDFILAAKTDEVAK